MQKNKLKAIIPIICIALVSLFTLTTVIYAATTIASSSVTYGDTTVEAALDELSSLVCQDGALCSKVNIGDYVSMTPTQTKYTIPAALTGYSSDQTINPSELNLWRVISINSDGTIDMVSEYVSAAVSFKGQTGYLNLVGTLNTIAGQYGNSNYTIRTRHMGYNGQTATVTDTSKFTNPPSLTATTSNNSNETVGGGDIMYEKDTELVTKALGTLVAYGAGTTTAEAYWLASRLYYYGGTSNYFWRGRYVYDDGSLEYWDLYYYIGGWNSTTVFRYIRPIVTLKSDVTATGSGTSASPWVLS